LYPTNWLGSLICRTVDNEALAVDAAKLMQGSLYRAAIKSASRKYFP